MRSLVLLSLLFGCTFASNIGRSGFDSHLSGYRNDDHGAVSNGYGHGHDSNTYGESGADYGGYGKGYSGHAQKYGAGGKVQSGADYETAAGYDKNSHTDALSGYGKDNTHKSYGSYDYRYKAPEYHVESYFSDENNGRQFGHDAHNQGNSDQGYAQQHGIGYRGYDNGYGGSETAAYGQQAADYDRSTGYGGYGNERSDAAAGGYGYDGYSRTAGHGSAVHPAYPYYVGHPGFKTASS